MFGVRATSTADGVMPTGADLSVGAPEGRAPEHGQRGCCPPCLTVRSDWEAGASRPVGFPSLTEREEGT